MVQKFRNTVVLAIASFLIVGLFQNCSRITNSDGRDADSRKLGGEPYDGKVYVGGGLCPDGLPRSQIKVHNRNSATVVRENCAYLEPKLEITGQDFTADGPVLIYKSQSLVVEVNVPNKISYVQGSNIAVNTGVSSLSGPAMSQSIQAGDLNVCFIKYESSSLSDPTVLSVQDNMGNSYRRAISPLKGAPGYSLNLMTAEVWYAENLRAGSGLVPTVQFSAGSGQWRKLDCLHYNGGCSHSSSGFDSHTSHDQSWFDHYEPDHLLQQHSNRVGLLEYSCRHGIWS